VPKQITQYRVFIGSLEDWMMRASVLRRSNGTGIGKVAGSPIGLRVNLDRGSVWYAFDAEPENVRAAFENSFPDFDLILEFSYHSELAGTTFNLIITGLSAGAGLVAAEFLKEAGKDLWKAFKSLLPKAPAKSKGGRRIGDTPFLYFARQSGGIGIGDKVSLTLFIDNEKVSTSISLPSPFPDVISEDLLKHFCEEAAVNLYLNHLKEIDQAKWAAPMPERLKADPERS
jgi:hypothetical protein